MSPSVSNDLMPPPNPASFHPATRSLSDVTGTIPAALRSEWIKLTTVRSTTVMLALNVAVGLLVSWAVGRFMVDETLYVSEVAFYWTVVVAIVVAVAGVLVFTSEVQHGTLATAVTAQPARWVLVAAKVATAMAFGLGMAAAGIVAGMVGALLGGLEVGHTSVMVTSTVSAVMYTSLAAVLGVGLGMIVRQSAIAVSGLLVWSFLLEGLLNLFLPAKVSRFLPFLAGDRLLAVDSTDMNPDAMAVALSRTEGGLVFAAYALLAVAVGTFLFCRRDVN
jgi:ABC-type transport system involved in multi-copper enzyme maturation permease subunit